jgi:ABC-type transporter Mla MlaB component
VVWLADKQLSERMQMEKDLDLEKAIDMARQSEAVKKQQNTLRSDTSGVKQMDAFSVDRVFQSRRHEEKENPKFKKPKNNGAMPFNSQGKTTKRFQCYKCGGISHPCMRVLPILPSAIPVEKWVTTSICALQGKLCMVSSKMRVRASFSVLSHPILINGLLILAEWTKMSLSNLTPEQMSLSFHRLF